VAAVGRTAVPDAGVPVIALLRAESIEHAVPTRRDTRTPFPVAHVVDRAGIAVVAVRPITSGAGGTLVAVRWRPLLDDRHTKAG
jgi:hypothetical protein